MAPKSATPTRNTTAERARDDAGAPAGPPGRIGSVWRRSTITKATNSASAVAAHGTAPLSAPSAMSSALTHEKSSAAPSQSTFTGDVPRDAGYAVAITATQSRPNGMLM